MEPGIIFLGTGGDISVTGKQRRASGGIVLQFDHYQFHIDPGPGALVRASQCGINSRETTAVFLSHSHTGHCHDINAIIAAMTYNGLDSRGVVIASESVLKTNVIAEFHKNNVEKIIEATPGKKIAIENVEIQILKADHDDETTIGFKFFTPKFLLSYTSDTKYSKEIADQFKGSDILIINCVYPEKTKEKQLCIPDVVKLIKKAEPKLAILTHFGKKILDLNPIYLTREIQRLTNIQVISAEDGMHIDPVSYSANLKQRTLNLYSKRKT